MRATRSDTRQVLLYVAGPYAAPSTWEIAENIRRAERVAVELWRAGYTVFCPHKNTAMFGGAVPPERGGDDIWLEGYFTVIKRCDALVVIPNWEASKGTNAEVALAKTIGIPVLFWDDPESQALLARGEFRPRLQDTTVTCQRCFEELEIPRPEPTPTCPHCSESRVISSCSKCGTFLGA
jgi:hypothetical protein